VTYTEQQINEPTMDSDHPDFVSASVLTAARGIYYRYCRTHAEPQRPFGVAIDRNTHRGHLIFTGKPILLPQECFVPLDDIEEVEIEEV
jgi:hypothetical protein